MASTKYTEGGIPFGDVTTVAEGPPTEYERQDILQEIARARDPKIRAALQFEYDRRFNGGPSAPPANSMRDGFPELRAGASDPGEMPLMTRAATVASTGPSLSDFLDNVGSKPAARAKAAPADLGGFLDSLDVTAKAGPPKASFMDRAKDAGLALVQGAVAVPQAAVGLADLVTGGQAGKVLENEGGNFGFRPAQATEYLENLKSPAQREASRKVQEASVGQPGDDQGLMAKIGRVGMAAFENPSVIEQAILQSLGPMGAGGVVGRLAVKAAPALAAGLGEGVVAMGSQAEQIRTDPNNPSGLLDPTQSAIAAGSGALTSLLGAFSGKLANRLGFEDVDNLIVGVGANPAARAGVVKRVIGGAVTEGFLEELPQSVQEQVAQNLATGQPWDKDVDQAAVIGTLSGATMGVGAQAFRPPSLLTGGNKGDPAAVARSNQAMDDLADADSPDAAIDAFNRTHIPITVPQGFYADAAMARMERARQDNENMLRDRSGNATPEVAGQVPAVQQEGGLPGNPPTSDAAPTDIERMQAKVPEGFQDRLAVVREKLEDSRTRQMVRDLIGPEALGDALYFAGQADNDKNTGAVSDQMLKRAETLLADAGVPQLPRVIQSEDKARSLAQKRLEAQAKIDEQNKTKETVAPAARTQEIAAAAAAPGRGLKERADAMRTPQKAALLTGNAVVNEQGYLEPLPKVDASTTPVQAPSVIDTRAAEAAASETNDRPDVTPAQAEAGNYKKGHDRTTFPGLDLSIENDEGSTRRDSKNDPPKWESKMTGAHYGYIKGTKSIDGEHMDVFVKPGTPEGNTGPVFIVDQIDPKTGAPDEHKVMLGFDTMEDAKAAYAANYPKDWKGLKTISATPFEGFKQWLATGDTSKPFHAPVAAPDSGKPAATVATPAPAEGAELSLKQRAEAMKPTPETIELMKQESVLRSILECIG